MFVPVWVIFLSTGLVMSVGAVVWGIRGRQFDDQERARFIPLFGLSENEMPSRDTKTHRADYAAMLVLIGVGMSALGAGLFLALSHI